MNTIIRNRFSLCLAVLLFTLLVANCEHNVTDPLESQAAGKELADGDIKNVVWTLRTVREADHEVDISFYPPFHLVFDDTLFHGNDGCNWFGASYEAEGDSIFPGPLHQTLRLCIIASFSTEHLTKPFRLDVGDDKVRILAPRGTYTYTSDFGASIKNSLLLRNWLLTDSTDPEFEDIQSQQMIPMLSFTDDRKFQIVWNCGPENNFGCDEIGGLFGIAEDGRILFYEREGSYSGSGMAENFMHRILSSERFRVEPGTQKAATLVLSDAMNGARFEFQSVTR